MKINYRFLIFYKLIFLSVIFFQSCNDVCSCKKVSCPGYSNPDFDTWFPYDSAEKIIFTSGNANDTAFINYVSQRQPYEANKGCYHSDMGCTADKSISSNIFNVYYHINKDWGGTAVDSGYTLNVYNFSIFAKKLDDEGLQLSLWLVHPFVQNKTTDRISGVATSRLSYSGGCFTGEVSPYGLLSV